jgi:hypothetical protein
MPRPKKTVPLRLDADIQNAAMDGRLAWDEYQDPGLFQHAWQTHVLLADGTAWEPTKRQHVFIRFHRGWWLAMQAAQPAELEVAA